MSRLLACGALVLSTGLFATEAGAQPTPPPQQYPQPQPQPSQYPPQQGYPQQYPPPQQGYPQQYPPPQQGYPQQYPPQYYPPPGYYYSPPGYAPPPALPPWSPGEPAPPGYHVETRPDWKLIGQAGGVALTFWTLAVITGAVLNETEDERDGDDVDPGDWSVLYIPAAGPFLALQHVDTEDAGWALLLVDGVGQTLGLIGVVIGFSSEKEYLVGNEVGQLAPGLRLRPAVAPHHAGLNLVSEF